MPASDWQQDAKDVYRDARSLLKKWEGPHEVVKIEYYIEELKEAPFDLKEAVFDDDVVRAMGSMDEILMLTAQLKDWLGES